MHICREYDRANHGSYTLVFRRRNTTHVARLEKYRDLQPHIAEVGQPKALPVGTSRQMRFHPRIRGKDKRPCEKEDLPG